MEYTEALREVNWLAVVVATLVAFVIGGLWYSARLFGSQWLKLIGKKPNASSGQGAQLATLMGYALLLTFVSIAALAMVMYTIGTPVLSAADGFVFSFIISISFVLAGFGINYLYEQRPMQLWLINGGYITVYLAIAGMIIGAWR